MLNGVDNVTYVETTSNHSKLYNFRTLRETIKSAKKLCQRFILRKINKSMLKSKFEMFPLFAGMTSLPSNSKLRYRRSKLIKTSQYLMEVSFSVNSTKMWKNEMVKFWPRVPFKKLSLLLTKYMSSDLLGNFLTHSIDIVTFFIIFS